MTRAKLYLGLSVAFLLMVLAIAWNNAHAATTDTLKRRFQISTYKIHWYEGRGHWTLRPGYTKCVQLRFAKPRGRCYKHRAGYRWHRERVERIRLILWPPPPPTPVYDVGYWASRQIAAAEVLGREGDQTGTDPWPNCPDPYDHAGASWSDTLACENPEYGWLDSPGFFRCGLQFHPMWESRFGRLCP